MYSDSDVGYENRELFLRNPPWKLSSGLVSWPHLAALSSSISDENDENVPPKGDYLNETSLTGASNSRCGGYF